MWQYTNALQEFTTSINHFLTNDKKEVQETTSFFTIFDFPTGTEEDLIHVDEYLNTKKNFNIVVIFLSTFLKYVTFLLYSITICSL